MKLYFGNMVTTVTTLMIVSLVGFIGYSISNRSSIIFTCERSKHRWMYRSRNYNDCSNSNTNCKITAYA